MSSLTLAPPSPIIGTPEASAVEGGWGGEGWVAVLLFPFGVS